MSDTTRPKGAQLWKGTLGRSLLLAVIAVFVTVTSAQALSWTYVNAKVVPHNVVQYSGLRSSITAGQASVGLGLGQIYIETYRPQPGYQTIQAGSSTAPGPVWISHQRAYNSQQKCFWSLPNIGGEAELTCKLSW